MKIDFHTHIIPDNLPDMAAKYGGDRWPLVDTECSCGARIMIGGKPVRDIEENCWDPVKRIEDMDREKVDKQVLSPIPMTFCYFNPLEASLELSRFQNDFIAKTVADHPERFVGLGTVPLQNPDAAIEEMDRAIHQLGLNGLEIGTNVDEKNLDEPALLPFFEKVAEWNVPLFIHPWAMLGRDRTPRHNFMYTVGMPTETALAGASLIWSGLMEKFPHLKICLAHGGGSLPYILPRLDQGWKVWEDIRLTKQPPSHYAKLFYYDSLTYSSVNIQYLVERFGTEKVLMGTDYPFLLREIPPGAVIEEIKGISEEQKKMMLGENASRFLNLK